MHHLDPGDQLLCAQLLCPLLDVTSHVDLLTRAGVDVAGLRSRLRDLLELNDADTLVLEEAGSSEYDGDRKRRATKEQHRDVCILLRCLSKQTLTGMQVRDALRETPRATLVDFIMQELAGWKPQARKNSAMQAKV